MGSRRTNFPKNVIDVYCSKKYSPQNNQTNSDIFDGVMASSFVGDDVKNWWRHNSVKNVEIGLIFWGGTFFVQMKNRGNCMQIGSFEVSFLRKRHNDVITPSTLSRSIWNFIVKILSPGNFYKNLFTGTVFSRIR